jgi:gamma-glutamylcyclotransferase (GGCT)/AIG2-like uncharacterized protein YtfP
MQIFVYGTLMVPEVFVRICRHVPMEVHPASLAGYRAAPLKNLPYPGLVEESNGYCEGLLYRKLPESLLQILDSYEGSCYSRIQVRVEFLESKTSAIKAWQDSCPDRQFGPAVPPNSTGSQEAWLWLLKAEYRSLAEDGIWNREDFVRDSLASFLMEET